MTWPIPDGAGAVGPTGPTGPTGPEGPTGPAGSANITGTVGKLVKFTGTTAGGDSSITDDGTTVVITEPTTVQRDALAATNVVGLAVKNTTASSGGVPVQKPAAIRHEGRARNTTGGGSDEAAAFEMRLLPVSGGTVHAEWSINYDVASGSGALGRWATNLPSMGGGGLYLTSTIVLSAASNGLRGEGGGNPGYKFDGSWNAIIDGGSSSYVSQQVAAGVVTRRLYGSKVLALEVGNSGTTTDAATTTAIATYSAPDETVFGVEATFTAWVNGTDYGSFVRQATFRRDGGTLAIVGTSTTVGTDGASAGFATVACALDASGTTIRGVVNGVALTTITWACVLRIVAFTP